MTAKNTAYIFGSEKAQVEVILYHEPKTSKKGSHGPVRVITSHKKQERQFLEIYPLNLKISRCEKYDFETIERSLYRLLEL